MSVIENVALPLTYKGMSKTKRLTRASEVLKAFHLSEREYYMPWQLSGGQTQRVAIARALVNEPSIILADEPTGNLDSKASHIIMEELSDLHAQGNTIIMVTHNPNLTAYASRVIHMADGRIESDTSQHKAPSAPVYGRPLGGKKPKADEETEDSSAPTTQPTDAVLESTKSIQPVRRSMAKTRVRVKKVKIKNVRKRDRK